MWPSGCCYWRGSYWLPVAAMKDQLEQLERMEQMEQLDPPDQPEPASQRIRLPRWKWQEHWLGWYH